MENLSFPVLSTESSNFLKATIHPQVSLLLASTKTYFLLCREETIGL